MSSERPLAPTGGAFERGLLWMVGISAAAHAAIIVGLILLPHSFLHRPPQMVSYTVDLVAVDKLGGTNLVSGSKGKRAAARPKQEQAESPESHPKVEPPPAQPEKPAESKVVVEPKPKVPEPQIPPKADEQQSALAKPTTRPTATVRPTGTVRPTPTPPPTTTHPPTSTPQPKATATRVVVKVVATARREPTRSPPPTAVQKRPEKPRPSPTRPEKVSEGHSAVATAIARPKASATSVPVPAPGPRQTHAGKAAKKAGEEAPAEREARERDRRIEAAIKRLQGQAGVSGAGMGEGEGRDAGGPISIGPGEGVGGVVRSVEYIMYKNRVEGMIKSKWTWAGRNKTLSAVVGFSILPSGEVANIHTVKSSGDPSYDVLAERAVRAASPVPPPPAEYQAEFMRYELTFEPEETRH